MRKEIKLTVNFKKWLTVCIAMLCVATHTIAQDNYSDKVKKYVDTYQDLAIQEQLRSGVPAAITLGQGILETEAGCSVLATDANNHFGIKCKKEWRGETFAHTDDRPNECFRKYGCAGDSYKDHSDYLKTGPRYAALFRLSPTDYAAWAYGLKKCGYATNPVYAQKLIKIIEDFELQEYTYKALNENMVYKQPKPKEDNRYAAAFHENVPAVDTPAFKKLEEAADEARATIIITPVSGAPLPVNTKGNTAGIQKVNGLKAIKAYKGDMLLQYAVEYDIRYEKLLEYNDLPDAPLAADMYLYIEKKPTKGKHESHIVQPGETMWQIAQGEPMQLRRLLAYNLLQPGEEPNTGVILQLQHYAGVKPKLSDAPRFMGDDLSKKDALARARQNNYIVKEQTTKQTTEAAPQTTYNDNYVEKPEVAPKQPDATPKVEDNTVQSTPTPVVTTPVENTVPTVTTPIPETKETVAPAKVDALPPVTTQAATESQEPQDELSRLKARLDKIVYASGDKPTTNTTVVTTQPTAKTPPTAPSVTPAPVKTEKKIPLAKQSAVKYHTVKKVDTAFNIAKRYNMTVAELLELNDMKKANVELGEKLKVK